MLEPAWPSSQEPKNQLCAFLSHSTFSDDSLVASSWPGGSIHTMEMLQSRALLPGEPVVKYLSAQHCLSPSTNPFLLLFIHRTVNSSLHPFSLLHSHLTKMMHLLTHPFICPSIPLATHVSVCFPSVCPTTPLSIHPAFYALACSSIYPLAHPF